MFYIELSEIFFLIAICLSIIELIIGIVLMAKSKKYSYSTIGKITKMKENKEKKKTYYSFIYEYNVNNEKIKKTTYYKTLCPLYVVNQEVKVIYNPKKISESYLVNDHNIRKLGIKVFNISVIYIILLLIIKCLI